MSGVCPASPQRRISTMMKAAAGLAVAALGVVSSGFNISPACSKIECGEYQCPAPFELKTDATCCGYCWAPDHVVAPVKEVVPFNTTGFVAKQCDGAPKECHGPGENVVRCFKPACRPGEKAHCAPGACCAVCTP